MAKKATTPRKKATPKRVAPATTVSLDDACRQILTTHTGTSLSALQVCDALPATGDDDALHNELLTHVQAALDSLVAAGTAHVKQAKDGSGAYYWV